MRKCLEATGTWFDKSRHHAGPRGRLINISRRSAINIGDVSVAGTNISCADVCGSQQDIRSASIVMVGCTRRFFILRPFQLRHDAVKHLLLFVYCAVSHDLRSCDFLSLNGCCYIEMNGVSS
ncbi:hypothetical protein J6590_061828 [Homalodisca vitripennis]|nr:hypothetical protein J6590_061828 [Homalodisca vitripennis]